jgi:hypothetical protein
MIQSSKIRSGIAESVKLLATGWAAAKAVRFPPQTEDVSQLRRELLTCIFECTSLFCMCHSEVINSAKNLRNFGPNLTMFYFSGLVSLVTLSA